MPTAKDSNAGGFHLSRPTSSSFWYAWHSLTILAILLVPLALRSSGISSSKTGIGTLAVGMAAVYCASVIVLALRTSDGRRIGCFELASILGSLFGGLFLVLLLNKSSYSRWGLILSLGLASISALLSLSLKTRLQRPALYTAAIIVICMALFGLAPRNRPAEAVVENRILRTSLYNLVARYHRSFALAEATGGGISAFGDRYLLATGDGQLHVFSWDPETKKLESRKLSHRVPLNRDEFLRAAKQIKNIDTSGFRTADILVQDFGEKFRLFASHHHWDSNKKCFTVRVSAIEESYSEFLAGGESPEWRTLYASEPCLAFKEQGDPFAGFAAGGKLALLDDRRLLLSVGDHEFDGVEAAEMLSQDPTSSYGKTILIDLETREASVYSLGHRNPQGLEIDPSGNIWLTEHGPKGGDELNLILRGKNYGWPLVTLGTDYTQPTWPLNASHGRHEGFERPTYAWVPSIGISALVSTRGRFLEFWKDDLLVSSLADRSIWRVRVHQGKTVLTERIRIGERIRDMIQDENGRLVLWTEQLLVAPTQTALVIVEPVSDDNVHATKGLNRIERGELLFARCSGCHRLDDGTIHYIGPDLQGVFERPVAGAKGYGYSDALKHFGGRWSEENLDAFLTDPQRFMPGTSMQFPGIPDRTERASLIEYLKSRK
jgi:cytochrome c2